MPISYSLGNRLVAITPALGRLQKRFDLFVEDVLQLLAADPPQIYGLKVTCADDQRSINLQFNGVSINIAWHVQVDTAFEASGVLVAELIQPVYTPERCVIGKVTFSQGGVTDQIGAEDGSKLLLHEDGPTIAVHFIMQALQHGPRLPDHPAP